MSDAPSALPTRKLRHIEACLRPESQYQGVTTGLERVPWAYHALPELDLEAVDLGVTFLGRRLRAPVLIGAMTGGAERAGRINRHLAAAAQRLGLGMMLGSQRVMLEQPAAASFQVRDLAPDILLLGNLGGAQFGLGYGAEEAVRAVDEVGADGLAIHVNPLQEALQAGGDTAWAGLGERLGTLVPGLPFPVVLKEVGHGLDARTVRAVAGAGFAALDVAGAGGTSWARPPPRRCARPARRRPRRRSLIASGGIRSGLDAARALRLGAEVVAVARPLLEPALESAGAAEAWLSAFVQELRISLFVAGFADVAAVRAGAD